jgi:hypothetical protein
MKTGIRFSWIELSLFTFAGMLKLPVKFTSTIQTPRFWLIVYGLMGLLSAFQLLIATQVDPKEGWPTRYNNYVIFRSSFDHLNAGKDLYSTHPDEHFDYYKYSPSFAVLMAPFALLPDWIGLPFWNMLNALLLATALLQLPFLRPMVRAPILALAFIETLTSLQNSQSNALLAGLIIWTFILLERGKISFAALLVILSVYIKIFGVLGFLLFLFYPQKGKAAIWSVGWTLLIGILPMCFVSPEQLLFLYKSWGNLLSWDVGSSVGLSVQGWLITWFHFSIPKNAVLLVGALLLLVPLVRYSAWKNQQYRMLYLAAILIWMVIFNHKAESPTFVIAFSGVLIWAFSLPITLAQRILFWTCFVFCSLSPTDLFPSFLRQQYVIPYVLKAVPVILIFGVLIHQLLMGKFNIGLKTEPK